MTKGRQWGKGKKKKKKVKIDEITKLWERKTERETDCCNRSVCLCTSMQVSRLMGEVSVIHTVYTCQVESGDKWLGFWGKKYTPKTWIFKLFTQGWITSGRWDRIRKKCNENSGYQNWRGEKKCLSKMNKEKWNQKG